MCVSLQTAGWIRPLAFRPSSLSHAVRLRLGLRSPLPVAARHSSGRTLTGRAGARSAVPRIAAVSCNPVSFARDAATLVAGGYALDWVRVVDQFRWSPHVELAALFRRG